MRDACNGSIRGWSRHIPLQELFGDAGIAAVANDALLVALLHMRPVCDIELERLLTAARHAWLQTALDGDIQSEADEGIEFFCALAQQCFINEYVYALSASEIEQAGKLRDRLVQALQSGAAIEPSLLIVVATYSPLHTLPGARSLMNRSWSDAISSLVRRQVQEPLDEIEDRKSISALTAVTNAVSLQVQQQYEENPYPRWMFAKVPAAMTIADYLYTKLPYVQMHRSRMPSDFDVLIAGCGTGLHSIQTAQRFPQARVLAIDISLPSLAYARRKSRDAGLYRIEYAQADILELGSIGRRFDVIESVGVLHHLSDPASGLKVLTSLLRPDGLMLIGLYSAAARRRENAARSYLAEQGYQPTTDGIRAGRQDLIQRGNALRTVDFFTISGCRDLMFNFMERQFTIPAIKTLLAANGLKFIGFEVNSGVTEQFRQQFADPTAGADLECWRKFEEKQPWTFAEMYVFWVELAQTAAAVL